MSINDETTEEQRWVDIGKIVSQVQTITHHHPTFLEKIGDASIRPLTGFPIAVFVLFFTFQIIRMVGEGLVNYVFEPIFDTYTPLMIKLSELLGPGFVHDILIGTLIEGKIDYVQSMGLLTTGLFVPFAMVLPYVFAFYLVLGFLEDCGYLPRLAVLIDSTMHKIGLHGLSIVSFLLGMGCNVPGALSTRVLETKRQIFIAATLMAISVPCMAQIAMIVGLVGKYGAKGLGIVVFTLFMVWAVLGYLLNKILKGESPEIFMEIPHYRVPYWGALMKKLWMRIRSFIGEAIPYVLLGVFIVNILYVWGIIEFIAKISSPIVVGLLGLPAEAVAALIIGFLRKDVAIGMLLPLGLTMSQAIVASVVLAMYFPCIATFAVLTKELGIVSMIKSATIMVTSALLVGGLLNIIL